MANEQTFRPNWVSPPGETILDVLRERGIGVPRFKRLMHSATDNVEELLGGREAITLSTARRLSEVLGASTEFWVSRDYQYREDVARLHAAGQEWLRELPLSDMIRFGWIPSPHPMEELSASLRFFGVATIAAWRERYASLQQAVAFRTSPSFDSRPAAVAAWLRQGELEAEGQDCRAWDPERFRNSLDNLRSFTRVNDANRFIPALQEACAESGVAVVVVRSPNGCRASGATRFLAADKAILQLSFRHLTDDHFWFTFFHEAGHLLLHGTGNRFSAALRGDGDWLVENDEDQSSQEERDANAFAENLLLPEEHRAAFARLGLDSRAVIRFARNAGVSPGIVVGQMQHAQRIGPNQLNSLKRRFAWDD